MKQFLLAYYTIFLIHNLTQVTRHPSSSNLFNSISTMKEESLRVGLPRVEVASTATLPGKMSRLRARDRGDDTCGHRRHAVGYATGDFCSWPWVAGYTLARPQTRDKRYPYCHIQPTQYRTCYKHLYIFRSAKQEFKVH